ncbi:hypothetical protein V7S43_002605 [Phytophthora oleae]|uniref:Uncharacterized protein n=1 Tax=Phytophthora oleae TaxID=2107226 RepID=A0ABD3FYS3_9STRA
METWNCFAAMDRHPQNLRLKTLVWSAETVWLVEVTVSPWHEAAVWFCSRVLDRQLDRLLAFTGSMTLNTPTQPAYEADSSFGPSRSIPGIQVPPGMAYRTG